MKMSMSISECEVVGGCSFFIYNFSQFPQVHKPYLILFQVTRGGQGDYMYPGMPRIETCDEEDGGSWVGIHGRRFGSF